MTHVHLCLPQRQTSNGLRSGLAGNQTGNVPVQWAFLHWCQLPHVAAKQDAHAPKGLVIVTQEFEFFINHIQVLGTHHGHFVNDEENHPRPCRPQLTQLCSLNLSSKLGVCKGCLPRHTVDQTRSQIRGCRHDDSDTSPHLEKVD